MATKFTPRKQSGCTKALWILFVIFVSFVGVLGSVRLISLSMRTSWRTDLGSTFPTACGSWAAGNGCTRVTLEKDGCTRPDKISTENGLIVSSTDDELINGVIASCVDDLSGAKLMSPDNFESSKKSSQTVHVTVNSFFLGFIDDLYIVSEPSEDNQTRELSMQS